eukprot:GFKZ01015284.1.p1 GENE.GFKZ01015284.1~~GFKZ01015284.1.p1  ORF type:complete len:620 (-),score=85.61 GFKZ01015284.1:20-1879(-)
MNILTKSFSRSKKPVTKMKEPQHTVPPAPTWDPSLDELDKELLAGFCNSEKEITVDSIKASISEAGLIYPHDPRLSQVVKALQGCDQEKPLSTDEFFKVANGNLTLLHKIASKELAIANFPEFCTHLTHIFHTVEPEKDGANAGYIPILRDADPEKFAVAFCSVDGQFFEFGDSREGYSIQSTSKPLTFAQAIEEQGVEKVLEWCGVEPSGRPFNDGSLLPDNRPFNPMVNSGALMTAAVLASGYPDLAKADKPIGDERLHGQELCEKTLLPLWTRLSGNGIVGEIGFSEETFLSERRTADGNIGMSYTMKARKGLPPEVKIETMIDLYLRACSITANTGCMAVAAATLANGGRNPITGDQVFCVDTVKKTLSVLSFCGFYDNAGEFFFQTGMPSKSGVSGVVFLVLPNVGGFAVFSPRLDRYGNSVRGSSYAKKLVEMFTFHSFDSLTSDTTGCKLDPRFSCDFSRQRNMLRMRWAVRAGGQKAKEFDDLLVDVCLRVAKADGDVDEREISKIREIYQSVMLIPLAESRLKDGLKRLQTQSETTFLDGLSAVVKKQEQYLDDNEKNILLETTFKVSTADGVIQEEEIKIMQVLSDALKVPRIIMQLKINAWKESLTKN